MDFKPGDKVTYTVREDYGRCRKGVKRVHINTYSCTVISVSDTGKTCVVHFPCKDYSLRVRVEHLSKDG